MSLMSLNILNFPAFLPPLIDLSFTIGCVTQDFCFDLVFGLDSTLLSTFSVGLFKLSKFVKSTSLIMVVVEAK